MSALAGCLLIGGGVRDPSPLSEACLWVVSQPCLGEQYRQLGTGIEVLDSAGDALDRHLGDGAEGFAIEFLEICS